MKVAEKRWHQWALTNFGFDIWRETEEEVMSNEEETS